MIREVCRGKQYILNEGQDNLPKGSIVKGISWNSNLSLESCLIYEVVYDKSNTLKPGTRWWISSYRLDEYDPNASLYDKVRVTLSGIWDKHIKNANKTLSYLTEGKKSKRKQKTTIEKPKPSLKELAYIYGKQHFNKSIINYI